ncbi:MAG: 30S ribosomal protein S20 [Simkaniaceae bacterium]|nr:30S ribosomal protein S20 [Simkaniaceae bacterium]
MAEAGKGDNKKKRPKRPTALKRKIQDDKKYLRNRIFKSRVKTAIRSFQESVTEKNEDKIKACLAAVYSLMDKGVKRGIYKKNKASRTKSRLTATSK